MDDIFLPRSDYGVATVTDALKSLTKLAEVVSAHQVTIAAKATDTNPTVAQREAGNYRKGRISLHGLSIAIENPRGSYREGKAKNGKPWRNRMAAHYGYISRSTGKDGDAVDVFIGPTPESELVFVINQIDPSTKKFDELKVMLGYVNEAAARDDYLACYDAGWQGLGEIKPMMLAEFKRGVLHSGHKRAASEGEYQGTAVKPENEGGAQVTGLNLEDEEAEGQNIVHVPIIQ